VRAERQDRREAVELHHRRWSLHLAVRVEWAGLCWLGRRQRLRSRPEVNEGLGAGDASFERPGPENAKWILQQLRSGQSLLCEARGGSAVGGYYPVTGSTG
jgi:hypothetical protein